MGMRIGYARVSSRGQKLDIQLDRLIDCERVFYEKASGATAKDRPELQKSLDYVRDEDVFVVTKLDRLARSVVDLAKIVKRFQNKNEDLVVLDQGIDTWGLCLKRGIFSDHRIAIRLDKRLNNLTDRRQ